MPSLILIKAPAGSKDAQSFSLDMAGRPKLVIGRQKDRVGTTIPADIVLDDGKQSVSRQHAVITEVNGTFYLQNVSRNGTLLNNKQLPVNDPPKPLKNEDRISIMGFLLRFDDGRPAKSALPTAFLQDLPDPDEEPSSGDATTIRHTASRNAAQEFLEAAPSERLRALLEISTKLASTLELDKLLPEITDILFSVFKQADRAFVIQIDDAGRLYAKVFKSRRQNTDDQFSRTIIRKCLAEMKGYLSEDASSDSALGAAQSIAEFRIRSVMCVPLATTEGKPLGAIQLDTQDIGKHFSSDDLKLLSVVANFAAVALEKATVHLMLVDREKQQREIELAKQVQLGFLPKNFPIVPGYDFMAFYNAAQTIGGDYYDFIVMPDGRVAVLLGDVAGKGVPAALLMAKLSAEAKFCILTQPTPAKAISLLNNNLVNGGIGDRFVTLIALVLDPTAHTVTVVNAGHITPLRYCCSSLKFEQCVSDDLTGLPLGVYEGYEYEEIVLSVNVGDTLTVFTDGVTDSMNHTEVTFEMEGVQNALRPNNQLLAGLTPKSLGERLVQAVRGHASGRAQNDDIAIVCVGRVEDATAPDGPKTATSLENARAVAEV